LKNNFALSSNHKSLLLLFISAIAETLLAISQLIKFVPSKFQISLISNISTFLSLALSNTQLFSINWSITDLTSSGVLRLLEGTLFNHSKLNLYCSILSEKLLLKYHDNVVQTAESKFQLAILAISSHIILSFQIKSESLSDIPVIKFFLVLILKLYLIIGLSPINNIFSEKSSIISATFCKFSVSHKLSANFVH